MRDIAEAADERLVVCVSPRTPSAPLIHATRRMADSLRAKWFAVYVEQPAAMLPGTARDRIADNLKLAADLGAETVTLAGHRVADEIAEFARQQKVTRIVVGQPRRSWVKNLVSRSPVDQLVRMGGDVEVLVSAGEPGAGREPASVGWSSDNRLADYGGAVFYLIGATLVCFAMHPYFDLSNLIMVYLLAVVLTATECGRGPSIVSSILGVLAFDFFFVPPRFTLTVEEAQYIVTFVVMCVVGLVISHLAAGLRQQTMLARLRERHVAALHGLTRQLASTRGEESILNVAIQHVADTLGGQVVAMLPNEDRTLRVAAGDVASVIEHDVVNQMRVARAAYERGQMTGWGTNTSPETDVLYVPLQTAAGTAGLLAFRPRDPARHLRPEQVTLLESLAKEVALALDVERMSLRQPPRRGRSA